MELIAIMSGALCGITAVMPVFLGLFALQSHNTRYVYLDNGRGGNYRKPEKPVTPPKPTNGILIEDWPTRTQIQARRNDAL